MVAEIKRPLALGNLRISVKRYILVSNYLVKFHESLKKWFRYFSNDPIVPTDISVVFNFVFKYSNNYSMRYKKHFLSLDKFFYELLFQSWEHQGAN